MVSRDTLVSSYIKKRGEKRIFKKDEKHRKKEKIGDNQRYIPENSLKWLKTGLNGVLPF